MMIPTVGKLTEYRCFAKVKNLYYYGAWTWEFMTAWT